MSAMSQNAMSRRAVQAYRGAAICVPPLKAMILLLDRAISYWSLILIGVVVYPLSRRK